MDRGDTRQFSRQDLVFTTLLKVEGDAWAAYRVKARNLSTRGMMAEGDVQIAPGSLVSVELPGLGWVDGAVAWKQDNRFGVGFARDIDVELVSA